MRRRFDRGNAGGRTDDNHPVHAIAELMDVIRDLCRFAALSHLAGQASCAATLLEQCGDLLAHRARLLAGSPEGVGAAHPTGEPTAAASRRGTKWTN
jgi:hypothetical protein